MRRTFVLVAAALAAATMTVAASAQTPTERPFPAAQVTGVFVSSMTVTPAGHALGEGVMTSLFTRGETAVFRVFAVSNKTKQVLTGDMVKYAYVQFPNGTKVKLAYRGLGSTTDQPARWTWSGSWTIPADFPLGIVNFKVLFKSNAKAYGQFVQIPVTSAQMTIQRS
jgi:hypothetical protein